MITSPPGLPAKHMSNSSSRQCLLATCKLRGPRQFPVTSDRLSSVMFYTGTNKLADQAMKTVRYLVRINKDPDCDWGASVPDLPGCVATGKTIDVALRRIQGAIELHLRGMHADGIHRRRGVCGVQAVSVVQRRVDRPIAQRRTARNPSSLLARPRCRSGRRSSSAALGSLLRRGRCSCGRTAGRGRFGLDYPGGG